MPSVPGHFTASVLDADGRLHICKSGTVSGTVRDPQVAVSCINLQEVEQLEGLPRPCQISLPVKDLAHQIRPQSAKLVFAYETEGPSSVVHSGALLLMSGIQ